MIIREIVQISLFGLTQKYPCASILKCLLMYKSRSFLTLFSLQIEIKKGVERILEKNVRTAESRIKRRNYSRISGSLKLPNLVEIQTDSFKWFQEKGIREVFEDIYPITNFNDTYHWSLLTVVLMSLNMMQMKVKKEMQSMQLLCVLLYVL